MSRDASAGGSTVATHGVVDVSHGHIDFARRCVAAGQSEVRLTAREVDILTWLFRHRGRVCSRAELLENVWGVPGDLRTRTVDMTISNLRRKIESDRSHPRVVVTVKGAGYAWGSDLGAGDAAR
ncbi:MAG: winged helix-turn-helix domain-containing protein [bacterium]